MKSHAETRQFSIVFDFRPLDRPRLELPDLVIYAASRHFPNLNAVVFQIIWPQNVALGWQWVSSGDVQRRFPISGRVSSREGDHQFFERLAMTDPTRTDTAVHTVFSSRH